MVYSSDAQHPAKIFNRVRQNRPRTHHDNRQFCCDSLEPRLLMSTADNSAFLQTVTLELTGALPDAATLNSQLNNLANGISRGQIAGQLLFSPASIQLLVKSLYQQHLNRNADPGGLAAFTSQLTTNGEESVIVSLLTASNEFSNMTDGTTKGYVDAVYLDLLGRQADPAGEASWIAQLNSGMSRSSMVSIFTTTPEYRGYECQQYFTTYLQRSITSSEAQNWMNNRGTLMWSKLVLLNTAEYTTNAYSKWNMQPVPQYDPTPGQQVYLVRQIVTQWPGMNVTSWNVNWDDGTSNLNIPYSTGLYDHYYSNAGIKNLTGTMSTNIIAPPEPGVAGSNWRGTNWSSYYTYNNINLPIVMPVFNVHF